MLPYVEILDKYTLKKVAIIEPNETWGELSFFDIGECEVYCRATDYNLKYLKKGCFVKYPNNKYLWVITSIKYEFNKDGARMISATGKEAKYIIGKRAILTPRQLPTTLGGALGVLLEENIVFSDDPNPNPRRIENFEYGILDTTPISDIQATRGNLLDFILTLAKTYNKGVQVVYKDGKLFFEIIADTDRSKRVLFGQSMDNLLVSTYYASDEEERTFAKVISEVEDVEYFGFEDKGKVGIDRSELVIESNVSNKYTPEGATEEITIEPSDPLYQTWLNEEGKTNLTEHKAVEEVSGEIDIVNSSYEFDKDFTLGDLVGVKDEYFNYSFTTRILKITFKQDTKGYSEEIEYGNN